MALITIDIPDTFVQLYNQRRTTYNAYAQANGLRLMPPATKATAERFIRDLMKGYIRNESYRLDAVGPDDGTIIAADDLAMQGE